MRVNKRTMFIERLTSSNNRKNTGVYRDWFMSKFDSVNQYNIGLSRTLNISKEFLGKKVKLKLVIVDD